MNKLKKLTINGVRGLRSEMILDLDSKSILLYGDNGSGKSSITDAIEWFFFDKIKHLSSEEIGRGGIEGLRCSSLDDTKEGIVGFEFTNSTFNSKKSVSLKRGKLICNFENKTKEFSEYIEVSLKENLFLRYQDLMTFILDTKMNKLSTFSSIIGFSDVFEMRKILKSSINDLKTEIKSKNFEGQISARQARLLEKLGQNITSDEQFFKSINKQLKLLKIEKEIITLEGIEEVTKLINPEESKLISLQLFYQNIIDTLLSFPTTFDSINTMYDTYYQKYNKISLDLEKLSRISLENLLSEGIKLLDSVPSKDNLCPLCLQPKNRKELRQELEQRYKELADIREEKQAQELIRNELTRSVTDSIQQLKTLIKDKNIDRKDNIQLKEKIIVTISKLEQYKSQLVIEISSGKKLVQPHDILLDKQLITAIKTLSEVRNKDIQFDLENNPRLKIYNNILSGKESYIDFKLLGEEKAKMEIQLKSLDLIYTTFVTKQKESLQLFLTSISQEINEIYLFMHPEEKVEDIRLSLVEKDDELIGISINYKFFGIDTAPPQKYLSESHLNCLGIALFLASVKTFNHNNKFFILDDVISSFDTSHRKRFADLLIERYSDYQIILMTHEKHWFDIMYNLVRQKPWIVNQIKFSKEKGTYIDAPPLALKERIEDKISKNNDDELGNEIRKYFENILKKISENLEVKMKYLSNERNEERMSNEMLTELKSKLDKHKCLKIKDNPLIDRMLSSMFIANRDSHDNPINPSMDDFRVLWEDVQNFERFFLCSSCNRYISIKKYDTVQKKIQCNCGTLNYEWKD